MIAKGLHREPLGVVGQFCKVLWWRIHDCGFVKISTVHQKKNLDPRRMKRKSTDMPGNGMQT